MPEETKSGNSFEVICPCCQATLMVDRATGTVLHHREHKDPSRAESISEILGSLDARKQSSEKIFQQEMSAMKDRERLLDEKLQEALRRAKEQKDQKPVRDIDLE
jgi:hypothetical protein